MSKHTPGPWSYSPKAPDKVMADGRIIAAVTNDNDANLIAWAPEMLAMLRLLYVLADEELQAAPRGPYKQLIELIAKAEGVSPKIRDV